MYNNTTLLIDSPPPYEHNDLNENNDLMKMILIKMVI